MSLTTVVIEEYPGASVQLRNNNALGTVDDERAVAGHQRQLAHVDVLFLDVFYNTVVTRGLVVDDQTAQYTQRCCIGQTPDATLALGKCGLAQTVVNVLQLDVTGVADNRHNRLECTVQTDISHLFGGFVFLQKRTVRI